MNENVADGLLPDVRAIDLATLADDDQGSGLVMALERFLRSKTDTGLNSFNSSI
jgi:hypothetical protein